MKQSYFRQVKSIIQAVDIYGAKIELKFEKNALHKTVCGGFTTFIIIIVMSYICYTSSSDFFEKKNPTIIASERFVASPERIKIDKHNTIVMVGLENGNATSFYNPSIYTVEVNQLIMQKKLNTSTHETDMIIDMKTLQLKVCDQNDATPDRAQQYFLKAPLEALLCFQEGDNTYIEGDFDQDHFSKIEYTFKQCRNSTENNNSCATQQEIDHQLKRGYFQMYLLDQIVDPNAVEQPFKNQGRDFYTPISNQQGKDIQVSFSNYYIYSDMGVVSENIVIQKDVIFADTREASLFSDEDVICKVQIRPYKHREKVMTRRYPKLSELVSQLGGILKILILFGSILTFPYSNFSLNKEIVNQIFNFSFENSSKNMQNNQIDKSISKTENILNLEQVKSSSNFRVRIDSVQIPQFNNIKKKLAETINHSPQIEMIASKQQVQYRRRSLIEMAKIFFKPSMKTIIFSFCDYILHLFKVPIKSMKLKRPLLNHSIQKIESHLDILYILNKFLEIDKLKKILLDEDQLKLFNYLPKPEIKIDVETENLIFSNNYYHQEKSVEEKAIDAYEGLINILKKKQKSKQDLILMELVDPQVSKLAVKNYDKISNSGQSFNHLDKSQQLKLTTFEFSPQLPKERKGDLSQFSQSNENVFETVSKNQGEVEAIEADEQSLSSLNDAKSNKPYNIDCKQNKLH